MITRTVISGFIVCIYLYIHACSGPCVLSVIENWHTNLYIIMSRTVTPIGFIEGGCRTLTHASLSALSFPWTPACPGQYTHRIYRRWMSNIDICQSTCSVISLDSGMSITAVYPQEFSKVDVGHGHMPVYLLCHFLVLRYVQDSCIPTGFFEGGCRTWTHASLSALSFLGLRRGMSRTVTPAGCCSDSDDDAAMPPQWGTAD